MLCSLLPEPRTPSVSATQRCDGATPACAPEPACSWTHVASSVLPRCDSRVRVFDLRAGSSAASLYAHHLGVTSVQGDDWKIVSGGGEGLVCVWETRMGAKLWEMHNR